jgi:hypothetical protein
MVFMLWRVTYYKNRKYQSPKRISSIYAAGIFRVSMGKNTMKCSNCRHRPDLNWTMQMCTRDTPTEDRKLPFNPECQYYEYGEPDPNREMKVFPDLIELGIAR